MGTLLALIGIGGLLAIALAALWALLVVVEYLLGY